MKNPPPQVAPEGSSEYPLRCLPAASALVVRATLPGKAGWPGANARVLMLAASIHGFVVTAQPATFRSGPALPCDVTSLVATADPAIGALARAPARSGVGREQRAQQTVRRHEHEHDEPGEQGAQVGDGGP